MVGGSDAYVLPFFSVQWASLSRLQPSRNTMQMEHMVALSLCLLAFTRLLIPSLSGALNADLKKIKLEKTSIIWHLQIKQLSISMMS